MTLVPALSFACLLVLTGCASAGPGQVPDSRRPDQVSLPGVGAEVGAVSSPAPLPAVPVSPPDAPPSPIPVGRLMGTGLAGFSGDGGPAWLAALSRPAGVTLRRGEILVSDPGNHRIRRIDADGLASTWLGPDPTIDPPLMAPTRLVADDLTGLVFFSEPATGLVRCVDIEGRVVTVLGGGSLEARDSGSGVSGRDVRLQLPAGLTLDPSGHLLVTDAAANVVWQVDLETGWMARVVAGTGQAGGLGDGGPARMAQLDGPVDVQVTSEGAIWVVEEAGHRVRRIRPDGVIERVAGTGLPGRDLDGLQALRSRLNGPTSVLLGPEGSALVADRGNARLVRISPEGDLSTTPTELSEPAILAKGIDPEVLAVDPSRHELHVLRPEFQGP